MKLLAVIILGLSTLSSIKSFAGSADVFDEVAPATKVTIMIEGSEKARFHALGTIRKDLSLDECSSYDLVSLEKSDFSETFSVTRKYLGPYVGAKHTPCF